MALQIERDVEQEYIYLAHPDGRRASAKLRALADCLRETFGSPPYWDRPQARSGAGLPK